jgi:Bacterial protein of unknown function (DUF937)
MLDILQGLIQQVGQQAVVQNTEVPNEHNEGVMGEVMQGLLGGLSQQTNAQGGVGSILGLLTGGGQGGSNLMSNPIVASIAQNVIGNIMSKFGLSNSAASGVVTSMLPSVLGGLISKVNDPNDSSVDVGSVMNVLSEGKTEGIDFGSLLSKGASVFADGKVDMSDLINLASGGGNNNTGGGMGGMMGSLLGGLFGKK